MYGFISPQPGSHSADEQSEAPRGHVHESTSHSRADHLDRYTLHHRRRRAAHPAHHRCSRRSPQHGRECSACHSPHSGPSGNGKARALDTSTARGPILWGEDVSSLYGKTITTGGGKFVEVLPSSMSADTPDVTGMLTCLSCDDGNFAPAAMMKNSVYETLPSTYGNQSSVPTLIGSSATSAGSPQRASYGTYRRHQLRRLRLGLCQHQWRRLHAGCKIQPLRFELRLLRKTRRLPIISRWSFAPPATSPT